MPRKPQKRRQRRTAVQIPYVTWRDGRPRFTPAPSLRKHGFEAYDLKHEDGAWYSRAEAEAFAAGVERQLKQKRQAAKRRPPAAQARVLTVARLLADWSSAGVNPRFEEDPKRRDEAGDLALSTIRQYRKWIRRVEQLEPELYHSPVQALDRAIVQGLLNALRVATGSRAQARQIVRTLSAAIEWGMETGRVTLPVNPCHRIKNAGASVRVHWAEPELIEALVAAADLVGLPVVGDMITAGVWTGQRQSDRLALAGLNEPLVEGRRRFVQIKTGAVVEIREPPILTRRLEAARERRRTAGVVTPAVSQGRVFLNEGSWSPLTAGVYRDWLFELRRAVASGISRTAAGALCSPTPEALRGIGLVAGRGVGPWLIAPRPEAQDLRDQDLRDTCVMWMARGEVAVPEIVSVTGHSLASATTILKHYLAPHPEMADRAVDKMAAWYEGKMG